MQNLTFMTNLIIVKQYNVTFEVRWGSKEQQIKTQQRIVVCHKYRSDKAKIKVSIVSSMIGLLSKWSNGLADLKALKPTNSFQRRVKMLSSSMPPCPPPKEKVITGLCSDSIWSHSSDVPQLQVWDNDWS